MHISQILPPDGVKVLSSISSKKRLFQDLGELAETRYAQAAPLVVEALMEREALAG